MASKKSPSGPPASLIEQVDSTPSEHLAVPKISGGDVAMNNACEDVHTEVMSIIVDIIYGESYRNFEIALCEIGMDIEYLQTFQAYVYAMLMNRNFFNLPGAKSSKGLAMAIAQAAEYFYKETSLFGEFILRLDKFYTELLSERELALYEPIKGSDQLTSLIDRILVRLHP